jgi:hypothetical protein
MEPDRVPSVLDALDGLDWHAEAACRDGEVDFFPDRGYEELFPGSPRIVLPLILCSTCPVRRKCLIAGLEGVRYVTGATAPGGRDPHAVEPRPSWASVGIWGGSSEAERQPYYAWPVEKAADRLEREFDARLGGYLGALLVQSGSSRSGAWWRRRLSGARSPGG